MVSGVKSTLGSKYDSGVGGSLVAPEVQTSIKNKNECDRAPALFCLCYKTYVRIL